MADDTCIGSCEYPHGVLAIDSGYWRDRVAACYLVEAEHEAAIIETGTNASVPRILKVLEHRGWARSQVRYVIATHVHLDHAGGAGALLQALPAATFLVHPRGARHMIDPSRLEASVRAVYGDTVFDRDYGELVPVDAARVREMADGDTVSLGERTLRFRDTPGHAKHHFCVFDEATNAWFTGDTFGLSYRETDTSNGPFIFPTTTPVQFDPEALKSSIRMLADSQPQWVYLTHYGRVGDVQRLARDLLERVDMLVAIARQHSAHPHRTEKLRSHMLGWLMDEARAHGVTMEDPALREVFRGDVELNTQGIEYWLDHAT